MATKAFTTFEQNRMQHLTFIRKLGSEVKGACKLSLERNLNQIERLDNFCQISDPDYTLQRGFSYATLEGKPINKNNKPGKGKVIFTKTRIT